MGAVSETKPRQRRQVRQRNVTSRRALQWLIALAAMICLPAVATVILISRTSEPDLFDLVPKVRQLDGYSILAWPDLERAHHALKAGALSSGAMIRALGYMMDGDQAVGDHDRVSGFVLLPDCRQRFSSGPPVRRPNDQRPTRSGQNGWFPRTRSRLGMGNSADVARRPFRSKAALHLG